MGLLGYLVGNSCASRRVCTLDRAQGTFCAYGWQPDNLQFEQHWWRATLKTYSLKSVSIAAPRQVPVASPRGLGPTRTAPQLVLKAGDVRLTLTRADV